MLYLQPNIAEPILENSRTRNFKERAMSKWKLFIMILVFAATAPVLFAQTDSSQTAAPAVRAKAPRVVSYEEVQRIAGKVMAPCCWAETADVHQSQAAEDVKEYIRAGLAKGWTEQQILDGLVGRYGERILAKPRARGFNLMVWILPVVAFLFGGWGLATYLRKSRGDGADVPAPQKADTPQPKDRDPYAARVERELEELD